MLKIKKLIIRNFMSVGEQSQVVDFENESLTLILGENLDMVNDQQHVSRNGAGKSLINNALSYVLYGTPISSIRKDNLINNLNSKNMIVVLEFEKDKHKYRIERGRKPGIFKFIIDDKQIGKSEETDEAQGEGKHTQLEIEKIIGMSHNLFKHLIVLNTNTDPFLKLGAPKQREFIEELFGIKLLSEKAVSLKDLIKVTKIEIEKEEFKIKTITESNKKIEQNIHDIKLKSAVWDRTHKEKIAELEKTIDKLSHIDVNQEIAIHEIIKKFEEIEQENRTNKLQESNCTRELNTLTNLVSTQQKDLNTILEKLCPTCGQEFHDNQQAAEALTASITANKLRMSVLNTEKVNYDLKSTELFERQKMLGTRPAPFYNTIEDAYNHKTDIELCTNELKILMTQDNPYIEQVAQLEKTGLQEVSYESINQLTKVREHQEFLLKLLTNSDSFIRKKIIEQSLGFLNQRLTYYLQKFSLPHNISFQNDLTVLITIYGCELDFDNLSTGEKTRLVLSLSFAFRDIFELLIQHVNLFMVDELLDNGADESLSMAAIDILKQMTNERSKNIWIISHRNELISKISPILLVRKENGFSSLELIKEYT